MNQHIIEIAIIVASMIVFPIGQKDDTETIQSDRRCGDAAYLLDAERCFGVHEEPAGAEAAGRAEDRPVH